MRAHDRRALFEQRLATDPRILAQSRRHQAELDARRADINSECDCCGYDWSAHIPMSRRRSQTPSMRCPTERDGAREDAL